MFPELKMSRLRKKSKRKLESENGDQEFIPTKTKKVTYK